MANGTIAHIETFFQGLIKKIFRKIGVPERHAHWVGVAQGRQGLALPPFFFFFIKHLKGCFGSMRKDGGGGIVKNGDPFQQNPRSLKAKGSRKKRLCRHMIDIWNRVIRHKLYPEAKASLTARREETLIWFLEEILGPEKSWEAYCKLIAEHDFLGEVTLDWALVPDNARKVLAASFGEKSRNQEALKDIPWADFYEKIRQQAKRSSYASPWFQICQNLAKRVGQGVYTTWFAGSSLVELTENTVVIHVSSAFKRDYILAYFFLDVVYAVQTAYPSVNRIDFQVGSSPLKIPHP